jgi:hypothetical protein
MESIKAAGCLFLQHDFVLAAYNPKHKIWSGLGGKVENGEDPNRTAFRETIEELFGFTPIEKIIDECVQTFQTKQRIIRNNYLCIVISFELYVHLAYILRAYECVSPYYTPIPLAFNDLINDRMYPTNAEITNLSIENFKTSKIICEDLLEDCKEAASNKTLQ